MVIGGIVLLLYLNWSGYTLFPEGGLASSSPASDLVAPAVTEPVTETILAQASLHLQPTQNITETSATLRGAAQVGTEDFAAVFFIYTYTQRDLTSALSGMQSYDDVVASAPAGVDVYLVDQNFTRSNSYTTIANLRFLAPDTMYHARLCGELAEGLICSETETFTTRVGALTLRQADRPSISRLGITPVWADEVLLNATVQMNDFVEGEVYLLYGESEVRVTEATTIENYRSIREAEADLQKQRIEYDLRGTRSFAARLTELEPETTHYYTWCVSYDGLDDGVVCTYVRSFITHHQDFGKTPGVTKVVPVVGVDKVSLSGVVDMRDFRNGQVFFVYGTDQSRLSRLGGEGELSNIYQSGDRLQVSIQDNDLDDSDSYTENITGLVVDTTYYARLCVEYENQNQYYNEVPFIHCSELVDFVTEI